jgi:competence protein ComEA
MMNRIQMTAVSLVLAAGLTVGGAAEARGAGKKLITGLVNLNTATAAQLDLLPGVGAKAAKRIIDTRQAKAFANIDDLRRVKGFGKKKLEKLRPYLTVQGPTTARLLKANEVAPPAATAGPPSKPKHH